MSQIYEGFTDEELIQRLREGEEPIMDYIIEKYKNLVRTKSHSMFILGGDRDDLIQEGTIGLFKAIRDYDAGRDASFFTFADLCITRHLFSAVTASQRQKHSFLNSYVSLHRETGDGEEYSRELIEQLNTADSKSPEELLIDKEETEELERAIVEALSPFEYQVLELQLVGMKYTEIARVLGTTEKAADNAIQRIRSKIRKLITKYGIKL